MGLRQVFKRLTQVSRLKCLQFLKGPLIENDRSFRFGVAKEIIRVVDEAVSNLVGFPKTIKCLQLALIDSQKTLAHCFSGIRVLENIIDYFVCFYDGEFPFRLTGRSYVPLNFLPAGINSRGGRTWRGDNFC